MKKLKIQRVMFYKACRKEVALAGIHKEMSMVTLDPNNQVLILTDCCKIDACKCKVE
jgi:hypothetical protein